MESGRMPACDIVPFDGRDIASGVECPLQGENINYYSSMQAVLKGGNRCDHDKNNFKKPAFHGVSKRRPHVLEEAKRRIDTAVSYHFRYPMYSGLFYHQDQDGKANGRQIRSERVEGVHSLALPTLLQTLNLHRMACGHYDNRNQFHYYNYAYLESQTNQSSIRIKREMKLLQDRGVIKVNSIKEMNDDGSWRTISVQIEFTDKIFEMLELIPEFLKDRETSAIKFHDKQARLDKNQKKRDIYRKPAFTPPRSPKTDKINQTLQPQLQTLTKGMCRLTKRPQAVDKGRGMEIRDLYQRLTSQGCTPAEAAEIIRTKYPPPH